MPERKRKIVIYHHDDADGMGSAAVIQRYLNSDMSKFYNIKSQYEVIFHICHHAPNEVLPLEDFQHGDFVYVVDYSLQPEYLYALQNLGVEVVWIDHHQSAIEKYGSDGYSIPGFRNYTDFKSGIMLAWEYFFPDVRIPRVVSLISSYDSWEWTKTNDISAMYFITGLMGYDMNPESKLWTRLFMDSNGIKSEVSDIIHEGYVINKYKEQVNKTIVDQYAYETEWQGYKAVVINMPFGNKMVFRAIENLSEKYDIYISWAETKNETYKVNLYTDNPEINVGDIARRLGGGGHAGAAGFTSNTIIK